MSEFPKKLRHLRSSGFIEKHPEGINIFRPDKNYGVRLFNQVGNTGTVPFDLISIIRFYEDEKTKKIEQQYRTKTVKHKGETMTQYIKDLVSFPRAQADEVAKAILLLAFGEDKVKEMKEELTKQSELDKILEEL